MAERCTSHTTPLPLQAPADNPLLGIVDYLSPDARKHWRTGLSVDCSRFDTQAYLAGRILGAGHSSPWQSASPKDKSAMSCSTTIGTCMVLSEGRPRRGADGMLSSGRTARTSPSQVSCLGFLQGRLRSGVSDSWHGMGRLPIGESARYPLTSADHIVREGVQALGGVGARRWSPDRAAPDQR